MPACSASSSASISAGRSRAGPTSGSWTSSGAINYYVHERRDMAAPLVVTDDDISGTFTFPARACRLRQSDATSTAAQIGQTWLNYIVERARDPVVGRHRQLHRAHRLSAPEVAASRRRAAARSTLNGKTVAEQIGAQIFIDGWAMVAPGDPELAADLAEQAGQRQPRRRGGLCRAAAGGDGGAGVRRARSRAAARYRPRLHPDGLR